MLEERGRELVLAVRGHRVDRGDELPLREAEIVHEQLRAV
jgi:hypothetical protein